MNKLVKSILHLIFGEWNGVQNFVAPSVLLFLFNQYSIINWITGMLTFQRFFLPLFVYVIVLFSVIFLCIKVMVQWNNDNAVKIKPGVNAYKDLLLPFIFKIHVWLVVFMTAILLIFILKSGFTFIYRRSFPLFIVYYWFTRISGIGITIYIFNLLEIAIPVIKRGRSFKWAQHYFHKVIIKHWKTAIPVLIVQLLWIFVSVLLFSFAIDQIQHFNQMGLIRSDGKPIEVFFLEVHTVNQFLSNTAWLLIAFLISNLMYSPLIYLINLGLKRFHLSIKNI